MRFPVLAPGAWSAAAMSAGVALAGLAQSRGVAAAGVVLAYAGFCGVIAARHLARRQARAAARGGADGEGTVPTLVAYASQTGFAEQIAEQTAQALRGAGQPVRLLSFADLDGAGLAACRQALFVVSTTGEGDAPDSASGFMRRFLSGAGAAGLAPLRYGILALGDSSYARFCGFGRTLEAWLHKQQAQPLFDMVEVDNGDAGALRHWQNHLSALGGGAEIADWERPRYARWRLAERRLLNPGSPGEPVFHLALVPEAPEVPGTPGALAWQAGDIAEIGPCRAPGEVDALLARLGLEAATPVRCDGEDTVLAAALATRLPLPEAAFDTMRGLPPQQLVDTLPALPHREYSIASLPADGRLELLVRQTRHADGRLGLASGWLTEHAPADARIALRVRSNRAFHPVAHEVPLLLVGNGTGLAGLRAHLKARAAAGSRRNWLLFGERTAAHDSLYADELAAWQADGTLERLDRVFSRDGGPLRYVQDALRANAADVRAWIEAGAAIYVCGSLQGMAAGVHAALAEALGDYTLTRLGETGRYRRDVY